MHRRESTGLTHLGVQAEVGNQLVRGREPGEVPDRGNQRHSDGHVDTGDRHQPQHIRPLQRLLGERGVEQAELVALEVQLA